MSTLDDAQKFRVKWLLGYLRGALVSMWFMCDHTPQPSSLIKERVNEFDKVVDELTELVEGMMQG